MHESRLPLRSACDWLRGGPAPAAPRGPLASPRRGRLVPPLGGAAPPRRPARRVPLTCSSPFSFFSSRVRRVVAPRGFEPFGAPAPSGPPPPSRRRALEARPAAVVERTRPVGRHADNSACEGPILPPDEGRGTEWHWEAGDVQFVSKRRSATRPRPPRGLLLHYIPPRMQPLAARCTALSAAPPLLQYCAEAHNYRAALYFPFLPRVTCGRPIKPTESRTRFPRLLITMPDLRQGRGPVPACLPCLCLAAHNGLAASRCLRRHHLTRPASCLTPRT